MEKVYNKKIKIREFYGCNVNGAAVIVAFATGDKLDISQMIAEYVIKQLKLPLVGDVTSIEFPPLTIVREGIPSHSGRIYGNKDVVIFISDYQFGPELSNVIVNMIYDFALIHQSSLIITMQAIEFNPQENKKKETETELPKSKQELIEMISKIKEKKK